MIWRTLKESFGEVTPSECVCILAIMIPALLLAAAVGVLTNWNLADFAALLGVG